MYKQFIALLLLVSVSNAQELVGWRDCNTTMAIVDAIFVTNCTVTPCSFVRGDTYRLQITATSLVVSNTLHYELTADFLGLPIPLANGEGCQNLVQGQCPATPEAQLSYFLDYHVPTTLPDLNTFVQLVVRHHDGYIGICIQVDVTPHPTAGFI